MISHTIPAAGHRRADQDRARAPPPGAAADAELRRAEPEARARAARPSTSTPRRGPWIHGGAEPRRAGVNAFGFGGINAHAVLEELRRRAPATDHRPPWDSEVVHPRGRVARRSSPTQAERAGRARCDGAPRRARSPTSPSRSAAALGRAERPLRLAIVADLARRPARQARAGRSRSCASPDCRRIKDVSGIYYAAEPLGREGKVVFVFPGEGAQYPDARRPLPALPRGARGLRPRSTASTPATRAATCSSDWVFPRPAFSDEERERGRASG